MLNINRSDRDEVAILEVGGRLDVATGPEMTAELLAVLEGGCTRAVLDMGGLEYISSAGLRSLLVGRKAFAPKNGRIVICGLKDYIKEVFEISGFISIFPICTTVDEALVTVEKD